MTTTQLDIHLRRGQLLDESNKHGDRTMVVKSKRRWVDGDRTWEVEWCSEIPIDEYGDRMIDAAKMHIHHVPTREAAIAKAKEVLPRDAFGSVTICEKEFEAYDLIVPWYGYWNVIESTVEHIDE